MIDDLANMLEYEANQESCMAWSDYLPIDWNIKRLKFFSSLKARIGFHGLNTSDFIDDGAYCITGTDFKNGKIDFDNCYYVSEKWYELDKNIQVVNGDVLITKDGTIGKSAVAAGLTRNATLNSGVFLLRPKINGMYLYWLINSYVFNEQVKYISRGSTINHLYERDFKNFYFPFPSIAEQTAIANFLDRKTAQIDQAIAIKEKQIALLKERKQILIQNAVTRGLDPTVPMKDSGVEWIGQIPEHWGITIAKHILRKLERPRKKNGNTVICSNHGCSKLLGDVSQGLVSLTQHDYQGVNEGDLLVHGMDAWHGAIAISKHTGDCTSVVHVCDSKHNKSYIAYFLQMLAIMNVYKVISDGVRQNTSDFRSWKKFGDIQLLLPLKEEQNAIVAFLDEQIRKSNKAVTLAQKQIAKLKEYKATLINSAVTGKIKVVEEEPNQPTNGAY